MKRKIDEELDWNRDTVKRLGEITGLEFCEVFRGSDSLDKPTSLVVRLSDGQIINKEHISNIPEEGTFFILTSATCGNKDCKIGSPKRGCSGYTKGKCGIYYLDEAFPRSYRISSETLCALLSNMETIEITKEVLDRVLEVSKKSSEEE